MCSEQQHAEQMAAFKRVEEKLDTLIRGRPPFYKTVQVSSTTPYVVDYRDRRHVYIWLPSTALTLTFEDYGSGVVQAQVWTPLSMPAGINVLAPNNNTLTPMMVCCTDEELV